jgi:hypothetical protein
VGCDPGCGKAVSPTRSSKPAAADRRIVAGRSEAAPWLQTTGIWRQQRSTRARARVFARTVDRHDQHRRGGIRATRPGAAQTQACARCTGGARAAGGSRDRSSPAAPAAVPPMPPTRRASTNPPPLGTQVACRTIVGLVTKPHQAGSAPRPPGPHTPAAPAVPPRPAPAAGPAVQPSASCPCPAARETELLASAAAPPPAPAPAPAAPAPPPQPPKRLSPPAPATAPAATVQAGSRGGAAAAVGRRPG